MPWPSTIGQACPATDEQVEDQVDRRVGVLGEFVVVREFVDAASHEFEFAGAEQFDGAGDEVVE